jgi:hypothetical protein
MTLWHGGERSPISGPRSVVAVERLLPHTYGTLPPTAVRPYQ